MVLSSVPKRALIAASLLILAATVATAQQNSVPDTNGLIQISGTSYVSRISDSDAAALKSSLEAARRADITGARSGIAQIADPIARKLATWALVDGNAESLTYFDLDQARRDLAGWPRPGKRQAAAEKLLEASGQTPSQIMAWFGSDEPTTAEGAMALASALRLSGQNQQATELIRRTWRDRIFDADPQARMLARFGDALRVEDHVRRMQTLLFGAQGPAARDMVNLLPPDQQQLALARISLRQNAGNAQNLVDALPSSVAGDPGLAYERAANFRRRGLNEQAAALVGSFPTEVTSPEMATRIWDERYQYTLAALRRGDATAAYAAAANSGLTTGADAAEAEFYAGWIALAKLKDPAKAEIHFKALDRIGSSPITRARALYWRGRAVEAQAGPDASSAFYEAAARNNSTFYGILAAERLGQTELNLVRDPVIPQADRARFEGRETVRAAKIAMETGNRDLFRILLLALDDVLPSAEEEALLVDLARSYGDQDTSMKVVRTAAQRGFILPERGYPLRTPPETPNSAEPALVLGITRQESSFDPLARSGAGARGMMQLLPGTAVGVARKIGLGYSVSMLDDPDYNMRLGSSYLGGMVGGFSGSYVMAIAGYNAGPGRPVQWTSFCGDPRGGGTDPLDFIECIPFSETRNYVMRVMENMAIYRARLNGGSAPLTLGADLKRGGYVYAPVTAQTAPLPIGGSNAPIPNP